MIMHWELISTVRKKGITGFMAVGLKVARRLRRGDSWIAAPPGLLLSMHHPNMGHLR
jgi:hypothetical protein